jgi:hypothetical protein
MKTIETKILVDESRWARFQLPPDIVPGTHRAVVVIEEAPAMPKPFRVEDLPRHEIPWPFAPDESFRREDLYGDDGR